MNTREYPIFTSNQTNHRKGTRLSSRPGNLFFLNKTKQKKKRKIPQITGVTLGPPEESVSLCPLMEQIVYIFELYRGTTFLHDNHDIQHIN